MKIEFLRPADTDESETPERCRILEIWNNAKDTSVSIARATVRPGITTQWHRLHGVDKRYLILQGTGLARIGNEAIKYVITGDLIVIPAGTAQQIINTGNTDLVFYCICTPPFFPKCYESLE